MLVRLNVQTFVQNRMSLIFIETSQSKFLVKQCYLCVERIVGEIHLTPDF